MREWVSLTPSPGTVVEGRVLDEGSEVVNGGLVREFLKSCVICF